jgi:hypothetical protein
VGYSHVPTGRVILRFHDLTPFAGTLAPVFRHLPYKFSNTWAKCLLLQPMKASAFKPVLAAPGQLPPEEAPICGLRLFCLGD